ncbi:hypothetical protein Emtol_4287 [Emticicia oligotrophica DSM 17448]|uniref:Outer membrane protein beta-barrel domain-containing protein n=1 Tax=Emticicia oligotrophica (strain DSM 17448 / CIP 109782 / MTCC 6937 / GPTSA100-15) TaxID=929562 RepID=A0ABN4ATX7_EMTOG|nr:hypothetical protein Emtol_4287 [Emticicia oligotrophica DSM 17448]
MSIKVVSIKATLVLGLLLAFQLNGFCRRDSTQKCFVDGISIGLTTKGVSLGTEVGLRNLKKVKFGIYSHFLRFHQTQQINFEENSSIDIFPKINTFTLGFLTYYYPLKKKNFRLAAGVSGELIQKYQVKLSTQTGLKTGGLEIAKDDFGEISFGIKWSRVRPYLGIGFGQMNLRKRLSGAVDIGCYYMGSPQLQINYEGFLETTTIDTEIKKIERNMKGYSFYPLISLSLRYKLKS